MKILSISDNVLNLHYPVLADKPENLAKQIFENYADTELFLIYVNYKTENIARADNAGILLLKYLRLNHYNQHCVLYTFLSREQLMAQDIRNLIIFSEGVTFIRMPEDLNQIDFEKLKDKKAPDDLSAYFRGEVDLVKIRHNLANIYGLWFMFNVHNKFFKTEELGSIFSKEFFQSFDSFQLHIANYLINTKSTDNPKQQTLKLIGKLKYDIREKNPKILYIDDKANIGWAAFLKKVIYGNGDFENFQSDAPEKTVFDTTQSFNNYFETVKGKILNDHKFIDCLLLDLRLADETGDIDELDKLSGIRLLKRIHQTFPSLPVVMITASNKAKSVKKIIECGAVGLWTKPGLDDLKENQYYLESYRELLEYLDDALNKYKSSTEKFIINAQFQVESIKKSESYPEVLNGVDIILTDTNFWCCTDHQLVNNHKSVRRLLNLSNSVRRKDFIVIDDVLDELFRLTKKRDKDLQNSAQFSLDSILKYKDRGWINTGYADVVKAIKETTSYMKEFAKGRGYHIVSSVKKVHSFHVHEDEANKELSERKETQHKALHADDTFQMLIPFYLLEDKKNLLLVTDDFKSVPNIIRSIGYKYDQAQNWQIPRNFNKEQQILKVSVNDNYCLITTHRVLNKICFPDESPLSVIPVTSTTYTTI